MRLNLRVLCFVSTNVCVWSQFLINCNVVCDVYVCKYIMFVFDNGFDNNVCCFLSNAYFNVCADECCVRVCAYNRVVYGQVVVSMLIFRCVCICECKRCKLYALVNDIVVSTCIEVVL